VIRKRASPAMQWAVMQNRWPHFRGERRRDGTLVWRGRVLPHEGCRLYRVRVEYRRGQYPSVTIEEPRLKPREPGGVIPHTYPGPRPCLFYWREDEWNATMLIADTIIPWTMEWLFFYEYWHATGEWQGGGVDHALPTEKMHDPSPRASVIGQNRPTVGTSKAANGGR